jgi:hypothetical protein
MRRFSLKVLNNSLFYWMLIGVVSVVFFLLAFSSAHLLPSRVDEGSFLIKGYYFITGRYSPFQDFGPWTNNMPLAYYIPGLAQTLFGTGLKTGRYFAIFLTALNLAGIWILLNRLKGKWWALVGVLVLAINPAVVGIYVQALSEGVVACLLTWSLVLLIGDERKLWQIAAGAFLCAMTTLTRQNMVILLPFAVAYAFLLHGKKAGWLALVFSATPFILVHLIFYPQIMNLWYPWLPGFVRQMLNVEVVTGGGQQTWSPVTNLLARVTSFFMAFRYHFVVLFGVFLGTCMLPVKKLWADNRERTTVFLLIILFAIIFGLHAWASLTKNYCVFCFPNYITFFLPIGLLIGIIAFSNLFKKHHHLSTILIILFILIIIPGLFLGSLETVGRWIMALPFPRFKGGQILSGSVPLWSIFGNRFGMDFDQLLYLIPIAFGFISAVIFILTTALIQRVFKNYSYMGFGNILAVSLFVIGIVLTPTALLGKDPSENTCGGDTLAAYEKAGVQLANVIPDGAKVYWGGESVTTPLLYITGAKLHPPQFNGIYSARKGGDRVLLEKAGYYNEASRQVWRESDEFFLIKYSSMGNFWKGFFNSQDFSEYQPTIPLDPCDPNSMIRIYKRN